jgi:putative transposase
VNSGPDRTESAPNDPSEFERKYKPIYPAAVKRLLSDRQHLTTYLRFPTEHRHRSATPTWACSSAPA